MVSFEKSVFPLNENISFKKKLVTQKASFFIFMKKQLQAFKLFTANCLLFTANRLLLTEIFHFLIFSNIWVAMCALVMSYYTFSFFGQPIFLPFLMFVFFSTLCSYTFHLFLTTENEPVSTRLTWVLRNKKVLLGLCITGAISAFFIGIFYLITYYQWFIPLALLTFLYSAPKIPYKPFLLLRGFGLGKTFYVSIVWAIVTVALPLSISGFIWNNVLTVFFLNRFFLILSVCILFDFKDRHYDSLSNIKNLVTYFDERKLYIAIGFCALFFAISAFVLFHKMLIINKLYAFILPEIFLLLGFHKLKNSESDEWYYGYLDGILMLSGIGQFLGTICS
jgi:hypothetical protein